MLILTIRTDKPEAEVGLFDDEKQIGFKTWPAHRQLAETLHQTIQELLKVHDKDYTGIEAIVCFEGPGSFTGLRIGASVANALAYSQAVPIMGATGEDWIQMGIKQLLAGKNQKTVIPEYGSPPHITVQKK